jgi:hypothetical protein
VQRLGVQSTPESSELISEQSSKVLAFESVHCTDLATSDGLP